jgi:hypothetical protein
MILVRIVPSSKMKKNSHQIQTNTKVPIFQTYTIIIITVMLTPKSLPMIESSENVRENLVNN